MSHEGLHPNPVAKILNFCNVKVVTLCWGFNGASRTAPKQRKRKLKGVHGGGGALQV